MKLFKDMDDNQYWMTLWTFAALVIIWIATTITISSLDYHAKLAQLVADGHDPIELACLFRGSGATEAPCLIIAQAKAEVLTTEVLTDVVE